MIIDDELNCLLVNPLPPNVRLHAVVDACHSGSVMDLEYRCKSKHGDIHWKMEYARQPSVYKARARALRVACGLPWPAPRSCRGVGAALHVVFGACEEAGLRSGGINVSHHV
jgi:hypothetical protein